MEIKRHLMLVVLKSQYHKNALLPKLRWMQPLSNTHCLLRAGNENSNPRIGSQKLMNTQQYLKQKQPSRKQYTSKGVKKTKSCTALDISMATRRLTTTCNSRVKWPDAFSWHPGSRSSIPETMKKKMVSVMAGAYNLSQHGESRDNKIPTAQ